MELETLIQRWNANESIITGKQEKHTVLDYNGHSEAKHYGIQLQRFTEPGK
jgi:hypothetical protein